MVAAAAAPARYAAGNLAESELRSVIGSVRDLPVGVARAPFSLVIDRELTDELYASLVGQVCHSSDPTGWQARLDRRRKHLHSCLGRRLVCVFIRLPGFHYTIEIDAMTRSVVHWEWQWS